MTPLTITVYGLIIAAVFYSLAAALSFFKMNTRLIMGLTGSGIVFQTISLIARGWLGGIFIPNGIFEGVYLIPLVLAIIIIVTFRSLSDRERMGYLFAVVILSVFAVFYPNGMLPPTPKKLTLLASGFFLFEGIAYGCFIMAGCRALYQITAKDQNNNSYDNLIISGFIFFSIAQVVGAAWCVTGWGFLFHWGQRHLFSAALWLFYGGYLHLRYIGSVTANNKKYFVMAGTMLVLVIGYSLYIHEAFYTRIGY